jgi:hypothetical protein
VVQQHRSTGCDLAGREDIAGDQQALYPEMQLVLVDPVVVLVMSPDQIAR